MNVLFIFTSRNYCTEKLPLYENMQFGISYISSYLKKNGHDTKLLYLSSSYKKRTIDQAIQSFNPSLICFTGVFSEYRFVVPIADYIKHKYPAIFLLAGGTHVTLNPETCIEDSFDALCIGEGEEPALELLEQLMEDKEPSGIRNLWIRNSQGIEKNLPRPFIPDLDAMPFPDREMWREWIENPDSRQVVFLGRGCPFPCTYCSNHALKKIAAGEYVRYRNPDCIVEEISLIRKSFPKLKELYLEIESFSVNMAWALDVCSKLESFNAGLNEPLSFGVNLRLTQKNDFTQLFQALKRSNFRFVNIGLESGSERVRRDILKRNYSNEDVVKTVKSAREHGLEVHLFVLIGVPGETPEDFNETVRIIREASPNYCGDSIFFPYPGTELYERAKADGLINKSDNVKMERRRATLDLPTFSRAEIMRSYIWFDHYVYRGVRPWYQIYPVVVNKMIKASPLMNALTSNIMLAWIRKKFARILSPSNQ